MSFGDSCIGDSAQHEVLVIFLVVFGDSIFVKKMQEADAVELG